MNGRYDDIIHLPHHVSERRAQMSMANRAAQFSPFAALTGYDAAIQETGRLTDLRVEMDEEELRQLDQTFQFMIEHLSDNPEVEVLYFRPDARKDGGAYVRTSGRLKKVDLYARVLLMQDGTRIPMDEIRGIECGRPLRKLG